jgi:hypothetical protein
MGGSTTKYGMFYVRLLRPGYQWSPVIGGSCDIGIRNANCAMLFLIILAALRYCVILDAKLESGKEQDASKWEPGLWSEIKTLKIHNN